MRFRLHTALVRGARIFAPEVVEAAERSVYARERADVLRVRGVETTPEEQEMILRVLDKDEITLEEARAAIGWKPPQ